MTYELPPTDPRFLAITEEEAAYDLLVQHAHRVLREDAQNPGLGFVEELQAMPDALRDMEAKAREFVGSAEQQRALHRALRGGTPEELEEKNRPKAIRIGGTARAWVEKPKPKKVRP